MPASHTGQVANSGDKLTEENQVCEQNNNNATTLRADNLQRNLEIDAYHKLAFVLFATGTMTPQKESLLKELREKWHIAEASWNVKNERNSENKKHLHAV